MRSVCCLLLPPTPGSVAGDAAAGAAATALLDRERPAAATAPAAATPSVSRRDSRDGVFASSLGDAGPQRAGALMLFAGLNGTHCSLAACGLIDVFMCATRSQLVAALVERRNCFGV